MRLAEGIVINQEKTFGGLKFSAMRREQYVEAEDGTLTNELKKRVYDLKCQAQGCMIQVSLPAEVDLKTFDYNTPVTLVNPEVDTFTRRTNRGADSMWYIVADDIVLNNSNTKPQPQPQPKPDPKK